MARPMRRRTRGVPRGTRGALRRKRADWVYRGNQYQAGIAGAGMDPSVQASYTPSITSIMSGLVNSRALILYDSVNRLKVVAGVGVSGANFMERAARAEGRRPSIMASEGTIYFEPDTWALGNLWAIGWRLGVFLQDPVSGAVSVPGTYTMWTDGGMGDNPAVWANDKKWVQEERFFKTFTDNQGNGVTTLHYRWRGRRSLGPDECFALYIELEPTSVNGRLQPWCRSLVQDEG